MKEYFRIDGFDVSVQCTSRSFHLDTFEGTFSETVEQYLEEDSFSDGFEIVVTSKASFEKVAQLRGRIFDEEQLADLGMDLLDGADYIDQDAYNYATELVNCDEYIDNETIYTDEWSGYIELIYVNPEFRRQGIGSYLISNLAEILRYSMRVRLGFICTYTQPMDPKDWSPIDDPEMLNIMRSFFEKNAFREVDESNYFIRKY